GETEVEIAAEQSRPYATGEHHAVADDAAPFRHHGGDPAGLRLDAADRALLQDHRTMPTCRGGDRRRRLGRFAAPIARGVERTFPRAGEAWQNMGGLIAGQFSRIELERTRLLEPRLAMRHLGLGLAQIDDTGLAETGLCRGLRIH